MVYILALIGLALAVFFTMAARQPDEFRVTRSAVIDAPAAAVFPYLNNLHKGNEWSPWVRLDPGAKFVFSGPEEGVDATVSWQGQKAGAGVMTITESVPNQLVRSRLEFIKPFKAVNTSEFVLEAQGDQTRLSWTMYGPNNFIGKIMGLVMNCDKMVGGQFEQGLANLKVVAER